MDVTVIGNTSDDPFAIDVAYALGQSADIADLISMKTFANSEFCPRFISDTSELLHIGQKLKGQKIVIVSASKQALSRQNLAMRNLLIARAAKENGAAEVTLVEPDLYYSAQDRGPHAGLGATLFDRDKTDLKKFDGQPFSIKLYAEMLKLAGVDRVVTVHNHSHSVQSMFNQIFEGKYHHLMPYAIYIDYLRNSNIVNYAPDGEGLALCAPDRGARSFVLQLLAKLGLPKTRCLLLDKVRTGEREVSLSLSEDSESNFDDIKGHDIVLFDDMVRTGSTLVKTCQQLRKANPGRLVFAVSHFYASDEGRQKMADTAIDEILTLNTLPAILNRDVQGRLRKKLVVLKIERWLARNLRTILGLPPDTGNGLYQVDMSSKNPRFTMKIWSNEQLPDLKKKRAHGQERSDAIPT